MAGAMYSVAQCRDFFYTGTIYFDTIFSPNLIFGSVFI
jgi:hypothetical protein